MFFCFCFVFKKIIENFRLFTACFLVEILWAPKLSELCVCKILTSVTLAWFSYGLWCSRVCSKLQKVKSSTVFLSCTPSCWLPALLNRKDDIIHETDIHTHTHTQASGLLRPKPQALLLVSIAMSILLLSLGLKGWPYFTMWLLYWAWSALVAPSTIQSASVRFWPMALSLAA